MVHGEQYRETLVPRDREFIDSLDLRKVVAGYVAILVLGPTVVWFVTKDPSLLGLVIPMLVVFAWPFFGVGFLVKVLRPKAIEITVDEDGVRTAVQGGRENDINIPAADVASVTPKVLHTSGIHQEIKYETIYKVTTEYWGPTKGVEIETESGDKYYISSDEPKEFADAIEFFCLKR
jgi:hypothetical protein